MNLPHTTIFSKQGTPNNYTFAWNCDNQGKRCWWTERQGVWISSIENEDILRTLASWFVPKNECWILGPYNNKWNVYDIWSGDWGYFIIENENIEWLTHLVDGVIPNSGVHKIGNIDTFKEECSYAIDWYLTRYCENELQRLSCIEN